MSELSKTRININNSLKNNSLPSTQKIKSFHYVDDIKEKSKCNKKMSELSKTRINSNSSLKNNNVLSTQKKRSLHYVDSIKVKNNKKIKQEQNKYKTEVCIISYHIIYIYIFIYNYYYYPYYYFYYF